EISYTWFPVILIGCGTQQIIQGLKEALRGEAGHHIWRDQRNRRFVQRIDLAFPRREFHPERVREVSIIVAARDQMYEAVKSLLGVEPSEALLNELDLQPGGIMARRSDTNVYPGIDAL